MDYSSSSNGAADAIAGLTGSVFLLCICVFVLAVFIFWLFMLIDAIKRQFPTENEKTVWLVVLIGSWFLSLSWLAAIVYYFVVKRKYGNSPVVAQTTSMPHPSQQPPRPNHDVLVTPAETTDVEPKQPGTETQSPQ